MSSLLLVNRSRSCVTSWCDPTPATMPPPSPPSKRPSVSFAGRSRLGRRGGADVDAVVAAVGDGDGAALLPAAQLADHRGRPPAGQDVRPARDLAQGAAATRARAATRRAQRARSSPPATCWRDERAGLLMLAGCAARMASASAGTPRSRRGARRGATARRWLPDDWSWRKVAASCSSTPRHGARSGYPATTPALPLAGARARHGVVYMAVGVSNLQKAVKSARSAWQRNAAREVGVAAADGGGQHAAARRGRAAITRPAAARPRWPRRSSTTSSTWARRRAVRASTASTRCSSTRATGVAGAAANTATAARTSAAGGAAAAHPQDPSIQPAQLYERVIFLDVDTSCASRSPAFALLSDKRAQEQHGEPVRRAARARARAPRTTRAADRRREPIDAQPCP